MKTIIMAALLMLFSVGSWSQQIHIKGVIRSAGDNQPVEFANIVLQTSDSVFIAGANSDGKGAFQIQKLKAGDYRLVLSSIGYETTNVSMSGLSKSIDLGNILIESAAVSLEEITVRASAVRNYSDRRIAFPTNQQKASSTNGINLLNSLMLPRLQVNPINNTVTLPDEGSVQFCINGIKVEQNEVRALSPQDIIRVEYHDNPGLRYGNAAVVLDYITRRQTMGGTVSIDLSNSPTKAFGDDQASIRFNHKKSEFGLQYGTRYRDLYNMQKDGSETYHFADGTTILREIKGFPGHASETMHNASLNYSLVKANKYYLNATFRYSLTGEDKGSRSNLYLRNIPDQITNIRSIRKNNTKLPSLDIYYLRSFEHKQTWIMNVVGTYIKSTSNQNYLETEQKEILSDILSDVDGRKYSVIGEGIYEKIFTTGRLSGGIKHLQAWTDNNYTGTVDGQTKMNQAETYLYAEFSGKVKKLSYTGGAGISRSWFRQTGEEEYQYYSFRPKVTLQYNFTDNMFLRLGGSSDNASPGLSDLSAIEQYVDTLQIRRGNPYLKPYINYNTWMNYEYRKGIFAGDLNLSYRYSPNIIMEETVLEGNKFIRTYANQKSWQKLSTDVNVRIGPIWNALMLSATGGMNRYISNGNAYLHTYTNWYYRASVMGMYKKFMAIFQIQSRYDGFMGESLNGGENMHMFLLRYNPGKFSAGAGIMLPFSSKYERESENRNRVAPYLNKMYSNDFSQMFILTFSWNLDFGRKFKGENKKLHNSDTDAGIVKSEK